jgi:AcrR family transcriptional regulator
MRITAEEKSATRQRILEAASQAFRNQGFDATTTRDIAAATGIATGTLFNYFPSKEAIVECLAEHALAKARSRFDWDASQGDLEEGLFAFVAAELRELKPIRKFISPLLETAHCPLTVARRDTSGQDFRVAHLETVTRLAREHGFAQLSPLTLQLYWMLYIGVLTYWASDKSPKQEDTLALLDQSLGMFVDWLGSQHRTTNNPR